MHIVQMTSAHPRTDVRVFHKQCRSLAKAGAQVTLVVADDKGDDTVDGVTIVDVGRSEGRLKRMAASAYRVYRKARTLKADAYHCHDPELIPWALRLKEQGAPVIFDAHEDLPAQIATKHYIPRYARRGLAAVVAMGERWAFPKFDGLVGATSQIASQLAELNGNVELVANYPLKDEFEPPVDRTPRHALFVGSISRIRGVGEVVDAMSMVKEGRRFRLVGPMANDGIEQRVEESPGRSRTDVVGSVDRQAVAEEMASAVCGIVTFLEAPNHVCAQPNKLFEYMSAGIPIVASNFTLWREIVEGTGCGLCVDPSRPEEVASAIDRLFDDPIEAAKMGARGREAVANRLNWEAQADNLLGFYRKLGILA
ncbi:Glycosyltransferase involved in cell wall bisynthesis [Altererythrobacter xiamenensis]|uniref:Glycosyltransferase involved in cell wall bisynthesis n=1 Tax=Altererythrobacter xiamenensis TaxID=1316679 RepID=A0A1Y6F8M2_9SPHN|nr:glycosyltransferase family 4 protein [Altererythrobacter xiamenensis]SMQ69072.1 Glycosyltransferase involved in cell wall bisynthesis [Altererythrobacter xiamenensis]